MFSMLGRFSFCVPTRHSLVFSKPGNLRRLSSISLHSTLPTTAYRLQLFPKSNLSAFKKDEDSNSNERALVSDDGLVYPRVWDKKPSAHSFSIVLESTEIGFLGRSKRAYFHAQHYPNARFDETCIRPASRRGRNEKASLDQSEEGYMPKPYSHGHRLHRYSGTLLPAPLIAFSFDPSKFSLQPLHPIELSKLNSVLDELYSTEATIFDAEEWFDQNPFHDAEPDVYDL
ncbi:hypothetical protein Z517_12036 [Fonsecaea pedrosoi CBS 271.37]|uniref:Unplaced genomic scaffold supercont1.8, whole genome shotgun sequence n=1 Tax=Fonsecaea pedrosoi CBS 271.37 TaxID=1442368 RepID=A0A0D2ELG9_9EURO|nr:uncharacterized protein Z517_12036 [Fonsecaea pedrosoi CBS 271.37]KIW75262.1 hypothetical protein Z517_12036 [Fonsecaea pedrosoi CBS 271.37]